MQFGKILQNVAIYFTNGNFFVATEVSLPPIYASSVVPPLYVANVSIDELTIAIDSARIKSKPKEQLTESEINDFSSRKYSVEESKAINDASHLWTISWHEDGDVNLITWEVWPQDNPKNKSWRPKKFGSVILYKPVKTTMIADWLIKQVAD